MATPLIINRELSPDKEINFVINVSLGDVNLSSRVLNFKTPNAAPLLSKLGKDFTYKILTDAGDVVTRSKTWKIERFQKIKIGTSFCIKLRLQDDDGGYQELNKKDKPKVTFSTAGSPYLAPLNNQKATLVDKTRNNSGDIFVTFQITQSQWNAINKPINEGQAVAPNSHSISLETKTVSKQTTFKVTVNKENVGDKLIRINNVHDILVFSYRQYDGDLNSKVKRKYIGVDGNIENDEVKNNETLSYNKAKDLYLRNNKQILNFTKKYDPKDGRKFIAYASIVRYTQLASGEWTGEWLQINTNDEPIWARAIVEASNV